MASQTKSTSRCINCGQPVEIPLPTIVDVTETPEAKAQLLSGRLHSGSCPNCGTLNQVAAPLLYHDPTKEMLIALVPMQLNLSKDEQERLIGNLMNQLPKDNFKSYMFNPTRALTMQGLIDQVLEADGITPQMMEAQRERVRFAQELVETEETDLPALVQQYDDQIDEQFFQTLTAMAQRVLEDGRQDIAQAILIRQGQIVQLSSYGQEMIRQQEAQEQIMEEVANRIQALGSNAGRQNFLELAIEFHDDDNRLEALVSLVRPAFDYEFFQLMTTEMGKAPASDREAFTELRQKILELTTAIDQQAQLAMQNAAAFLQAVANHQSPAQFMQSNMHMIDNTFMAVLSQNIQHAESQGNVQVSARLKSIYELAVQILQETMQPELRFINELLSAENDTDATVMIRERVGEFDEELLEVMDAVEEILTSQGKQGLVTRLQTLRDEARQAMHT